MHNSQGSLSKNRRLAHIDYVKFITLRAAVSSVKLIICKAFMNHSFEQITNGIKLWFYQVHGTYFYCKKSGQSTTIKSLW
jgi:hypothetical protein